jgi:hypothetical protein
VDLRARVKSTSESDWGMRDQFIKCTVIFFFLAAMGWTVWEVSALNTKEASDASHRASRYAKDTEQQIIEICTVSELTTMRECVTEKVKAGEENQRAVHNLAAQNAVANWTLGMFVLGFIGTGLTGFGLYYLAANLSEMQEQRAVTESALHEAREANSLTRTDQRAWVTIDVKFLGPVTVRGDGMWSVRLVLVIKNVGKTPAHDLAINVLILNAFNNTSAAYEKFFADTRGMRQSGGVGGGGLAPNEERTITADYIIQPENLVITDRGAGTRYHFKAFVGSVYNTTVEAVTFSAVFITNRDDDGFSTEGTHAIFSNVGWLVVHTHYT